MTDLQTTTADQRAELPERERASLAIDALEGLRLGVDEVFSIAALIEMIGRSGDACEVSPSLRWLASRLLETTNDLDARCQELADRNTALKGGNPLAEVRTMTGR